MKKQTFTYLGLSILGLVAALALGGVALAHGAGPGLAGFHGGGGPAKLFGLIRDLDLNEQQMQHLDALRDVADGVRQRHAEQLGTHAEHVLAKLESGETFEAANARALIDEHLEQMRATAYAVTDELTALANSLDAEQRATLAEHLRTAIEAHGEEGLEGGFHGHGRFFGAGH